MAVDLPDVDTDELAVLHRAGGVLDRLDAEVAREVVQGAAGNDDERAAVLECDADGRVDGTVATDDADRVAPSAASRNAASRSAASSRATIRAAAARP